MARRQRREHFNLLARRATQAAPTLGRNARLPYVKTRGDCCRSLPMR